MLSSSRDMSLKPWHVFVRVFSMLVSTQDCSKGIRKSKSENFWRRPRSSAEGQGKSCPMGVQLMGWALGLGLGIVEVKGVLKNPNPSSCCFWISGNVLVLLPPTPKTYFIWRILSVRSSYPNKFRWCHDRLSQITPWKTNMDPSKWWRKRLHSTHPKASYLESGCSFSKACNTLISNPAPMHTCLRYVRTRVHVCVHAFILCMKSTRAEFLMYLQEYICFWCRPLVKRLTFGRCCHVFLTPLKLCIAGVGCSNEDLRTTEAAVRGCGCQLCRA